MKEAEFKIETGKVVAFDQSTARGRVSLAQGKEIEFHSTSFQSSLPTRFPRLGETVNVTFSYGRIVSVHSS